MTINTIAKMAGVSPATVSRYLNQGYVSEEKKERIRNVIEQTGYSPSPSAQMLRTGKNHLVGVIVPRINSEPVAEMVEGITRIMAQAGYQILLANTSNQVEKELEFLKIFRTNNVDGVIFMGTLMSKRHLTVMRSYQKPIVLLAQQEEIIPSVYFDDYQSAYLATEILLKRDCREIAYIGVTLKDRAVGRNRRIGFTDALAQYQIQPDERRMVETQFDMEDGYEAARILMERNVPFDGIFCATAELAFGARGRFFARAVATDGPGTVEVLKAAANHKGASVCEILQNCVIFNDGTHESVYNKEGRAKNAIYLEHGKPMLFGENKEFGLMQEGFGLKVVKLGENGITEKDILIHDAHCMDNTLQLKLALMEGPDFPIALGVIRDVEAPTYDDAVHEQIDEVSAKKKYHNFRELLMTNDIWEVK